MFRVALAIVTGTARGLVVLLPLLGLFWAAAGFVLHLRGQGDPVSYRMHAAEEFFVPPALAQLAALITVLRGRRDHPLVRWWSRYTGVTGGLVLVAVVLTRDRVDDWFLHAVPVIVTVAAAVITLLLTLGVEPAAPVRSRGPARARVAELTQTERDAVGADLEAALDDLAARGVISGEVRDKVRHAPLGALTVTLNAPRKHKSVG